MAFETKDLFVLTYANNFTQWHYITDDNGVMDAGYFDSENYFRLNDLIICQYGNEAYKKTDFLLVIKAEDGLVEVKKVMGV